VSYVDDVRAGVRSPEEQAILREEVVEALARLTPKQREAVLLTVALGLTQEEAGRAAGVTHSAISQRLKQASREETGQT